MRLAPFLSCRAASRLITVRFDRPLGPLERARLAVHLRICDACPHVVAQFELIRGSMEALRATVETDSP